MRARSSPRQQRLRDHYAGRPNLYVEHLTLNNADPDRMIEISEHALSIPAGYVEYDDGATAVAVAAVVAYATGAHGRTALDDLLDPPPELRGRWADANQLDELTHQFDTLTNMLHGTGNPWQFPASDVTTRRGRD